MPAHFDSVNMTQLYKEAKPKKQNLKKPFTVVKQDISEKEKHWIEQI